VRARVVDVGFVCVCVCARARVCACACVCVVCGVGCLQLCGAGEAPYPQGMYVCLLTRMHTNMPACIHTYIHTYKQTNIHTYIHTYTHTHTHTYTHTHTHTQAMHRIHKFSKEITIVSSEIATGNFNRVGTMLPVKVNLTPNLNPNLNPRPGKPKP